MKVKIKEMFQEEEKALNKLVTEINKSDNIEKKAEIAKEVLTLVNQMIIDLENIKEHQEYKDYKNALFVRKEVAEGLIKLASEESSLKAKAMKSFGSAIKRIFSK